MEITYEEFDQLIRQRLRLNQFLLFISIAISLTIFIWRHDYVFWSLYFLTIGSLSLYNINHAKYDRRSFQKGEFRSTQGVLIDVFPENDSGKNWIIFLQEEDGKIKEFLVPKKPDVKLQQTCQCFYTPKNEILVKIQ